MKRPIAKVDVEVGKRVRLRRLQLNISQTTLANELGVSFQQVQKYEKGTNRISASRLQRIADVLKVPISFLFGDAAGVNEQNRNVMAFMESAYSLRLIQAFSKIGNKKLQQALLVLVEKIAEKERT